MTARSLGLGLLLLSANAFAQELMLEPVASVTNPSFVTQAPGETDRLFITSQQLGIHVVENGVLLNQLFLDVEAETAAAGGLHYFGLTSLAFHPDYQTNGRFFISYMDRTLMSHIAEYRVSATDPNVADPATRVQILGPHPNSFHSHNWNQLFFGPDGMLYIATGDDQQSAQSTVNVSQDLSSYNGKILRLDVDGPAPYVPVDNPLVGKPGVDERVYAYGLRQPWRMSYDPGADHFFVGDVGAQDREEISVVDFSSLAGANFGWRCLEGTQCTGFAVGCLYGCNDPMKVDPIYEFPHDSGRCAVIGGYVYRGAAIPSLQGQYLFADYCTARVWSFAWTGTALTGFQEHTNELQSCDGTQLGLSVSFGIDNAGEMYICDQQNATVWKIVPGARPENYCVTSPNSAGPGAEIGSAGSPSVTAGNFTLTAAGAPPGQFGLFYYGRDQSQFPLGNGMGCVGAGGLWYFRFTPPELSDPSGGASLLVDFAAPPAGLGAGAIGPGSTWHFQYWYRDPAAGGAAFNLSDALRVTFCP